MGDCIRCGVNIFSVFRDKEKLHRVWGDGLVNAFYEAYSQLNYWIYPRVQGGRSVESANVRSAVSWKLHGSMAKLLRWYVVMLANARPVESGLAKRKRDPKVIISLTTFPARIDTVWLCTETLLRQRVKPDEIILWLAAEEFPGGLDNLPEKLLAQRDRGLTIRFRGDLKSHKKYYYAFREYPGEIIITADDDVFYPDNLVEELLKLHEQYPDCICCNRACRMVLNDARNIAAFTEWDKWAHGFEGPSKLLCPIGVGGVMYPPGAMHEDVLDKETFMNICRHADDLWLKLMSLRKGTDVVKSPVLPDALLSIPDGRKKALSTINVDAGGNDRQLEALLRRYDVRPDWLDAVASEKTTEVPDALEAATVER